MQESVIIASWGITNISINDTSICFEVSGFKFSGKVEIYSICDEQYEIKLAEQIIGQHGLGTIVEVLDNAIEKTDDYQQYLKEWIMKRLNG